VAIPFIYGGVTVNSLDINVILLSSAAFFTNTYREIIKGIMDIKGDREFNIQTLAVKYGPDRAYYISLIFLSGAIIISIIPFLYLSLPNLISYTFLIGLTDLTLIYSAIILRDGGRMNSESLKFSKRICLLGMFLGMMSFVAGVT
jgi:4-hydroxybenzoate polyprenyltransferase